MLQQLENLISDDDIAFLERHEGLTFTANTAVPKADRKLLLKTIKSIDVQACPGSGKTTLIAAKLMLLAQKWPFKHQGICVLSHTNVAKNEIIHRLEDSRIPAVKKLLGYPHFIGTIQEFTNKFLGIPLLRSWGIEVNMIDTDNCVEQIRRKLSIPTKAYIDNKSQFHDVLYDFSLKVEADKIEMNVPTFPNGSESKSYQELKDVRVTLIKNGYFFYHDFYVFAEMISKENPAISSFLQKRFPIIFIDEMQDTQKFQDSLLQTIFPLDCNDITVQRFGDPDQAIFNGINEEEPNDSYNSKLEMDFIINLSHRFDNSIANKIKSLSFNSISLGSELSNEQIAKRSILNNDGTQFQHTIFIYDGNTIGSVIPKFSDLVQQQFKDELKQKNNFTVKVIGAVGNEIDPNKIQLKIGHYWNGYDKKKTKSSFKPSSLIEAIYYCRNLPQNDFSAGYKFLNDYIVSLLRASEQKDIENKFFTATTWAVHLKNNKTWQGYRKFLYWILNSDTAISQESWSHTDKLFKSLLGKSILPTALNTALIFSEVTQQKLDNTVQTANLSQLNDNIIQHESGFKMQISTIHSVKGETHDATLILETKNYNPDIQAMMRYITGVLPNTNNPNSKLRPDPSNAKNLDKMANQKFMRQLYVAMSRSKYLLCVAVNKDNITQADITNLQGLGWKIQIT
jgi:hypothetical protein